MLRAARRSARASSAAAAASAGMRCAVRTGGSVPRGIGSRRSSEGSRSIVCPAGISSSDAGTDSDASPGTMKCESGRPRCSRRTCSAMLVCGPTFIRSSST